MEANNISAEVSVSGGSDAEASKAEASKTQSDEKGHIRTTSTLKKFASFKPVSVNKTFLAAKGATTATPSKSGEKGTAGLPTAQIGPSSSTALRPRLVAKSGSGLRDATPRSAASANGGKAGAAPDANAVWNKNRRKLQFRCCIGVGLILYSRACARTKALHRRGVEAAIWNSFSNEASVGRSNQASQLGRYR